MAEASPIIEEFQSTPPAWGAKSIFCMPAPWLPIFQSTPPRMGSDPPHFYSNNDIMEFQSTLPAWGATSAASRTVSAQDYFNPRSRMGSDVNIQAMVVELSISIHAPAWGATSAHQSEDDDEPHISIHAPRMGSDINRGIPPHAPRAFQSTPPHGERHDNEIAKAILYHISIHAPAWGATQLRTL